MSSLTSEDRIYSRADCIVFRKTNEKFGGLSNMAPGFLLAVNGIRIATSEALYQACRFPDAPHVQKLILAEASPMTAKMRSKKYRKTDSRTDWDAVRVKVMRWCLRVKLAQNWDKFSHLLADTCPLPIVEESSKDIFWGAKSGDGSTLVGRNVLGRLLMELRKELIEGQSQAYKTVPPLDIPNFLLLGSPIDIVLADGSNSQSATTFRDPSRKANNVFVSHSALDYDKVKLDEVFSQLKEHGFSKIVQDLNGWRVTIVKLKGAWSRRHSQDELLLVLGGSLHLHLHGRVLPLNAGELFMVRRDTESFSMSAQDADFLLLQAKSSSGDIPQLMLY